MPRRPDELRPRLADGALLRHDDVRDVDVLLLPERVVTLNPTGRAILQLCDGSRTLAEICELLERRYSGAAVTADVAAFVDAGTQNGLLR